MLTLFTIPKPFKGHIGMIQTNAIDSWRRLGVGTEIILFGNEAGAAEAAARAGVFYEPDVLRNEYGTPILSDVFRRAEERAKGRLLCYINADILLLSDFSEALRRAAKCRRFLMVGQRTNLDVIEPVDFGAADWESCLRCAIAERGRLLALDWVDYFAFSKGLWKSMPPFAVGRTVFDNWLIYGAWRRFATVINATGDVTAVHQNHDYNHVSGGESWVWKGPEAQRNLELAGGAENCFTIADATHQLRQGRLVPSMSRIDYLRRQGKLRLRPYPRVFLLGRSAWMGAKAVTGLYKRQRRTGNLGELA